MKTEQQEHVPFTVRVSQGRDTKNRPIRRVRIDHELIGGFALHPEEAATLVGGIADALAEISVSDRWR